VSANSAPLVEIHDLTIAYSTPRGELRAVEDVNLSVFKGEILGLVGESGCGKSTLASALLRMIPVPGKIVNGSVRFGEIDVISLRQDDLRHFRWEKVSMIFQSAMNALDPVRTVCSQITETIHEHNSMGGESLDRVKQLLESVGLSPMHMYSYPHQLSGGMRQRVAIALALCLNPQLLIADEPTTALDVVVQAGILTTLKDLQERLGLTVVLITHDLSLAAAICDRIAVMYAGKIVELGETEKITVRPEHPYTEALINSVPELGDTKQKIQGIAGSPPSLISPPTGCRFHPRCKYVFERCMQHEPSLVRANRTDVACWLRG